MYHVHMLLGQAERPKQFMTHRGDSNTTRSTSGFFLELEGRDSGNSWPLAHKAQFQSFTASSSAESETASASAAIRHTALPVQQLLEEMLGRLVPICCKVDNSQCIAAIKNGYSKRLRFLSRTHRCSIAVLHELSGDPEVALEVEHVGTKEHKGDFYTKPLPAPAFFEGRARTGLRSPPTSASARAASR